MFEAMGLWPDVVAASTPITSIHVSDKGRFGFSHIDALEQKVEALGYVVINRLLGEVLQASLANLQDLDFLCPAKIKTVHQSADRVEVGVEAASPQTLTTRLLVAADGANSAVREMIGISAATVDYAQCAVVGNVLPESPPANRAPADRPCRLRSPSAPRRPSARRAGRARARPRS
jgi:2-octaprenyl-6-methoxyphenol hydroxylase